MTLKRIDPSEIRLEARPKAVTIGQSIWSAYIPTLHRILASPDEEIPFPRISLTNGHTHAYWEAAAYLLRRLMGWRDLGAGLRWWVRAGTPLDDERLRLFHDIYVDDGSFAPFAMWAWTCGLEGTELDGDRDPDNFSGAAFAKQADNQAQAQGISKPSELHLGHSCVWAHADPEPGSFSVFANARGVAVVVDRLAIWPAVLNTIEAKGEGFRVELVCRPVGWLGTFRKSAVTGRWFLGKHSVHMAGA